MSSKPNKYRADGSRRDTAVRPIEESFNAFRVEVLGPLVDSEEAKAFKVAFYAGAGALWAGLQSAMMRDNAEEESGQGDGWIHTKALYDAIESDLERHRKSVE